eukprot:TRINITY_DN37723_c0_g1_i1.p1 TRINITY_DN37723_c0_g1~~TRINITY_DN37723_c0_g1_i1.p1  ORF type:complete len:653 (+),score=119.83 TRINITY_DN37723_c0_g1_i1:126-2084(+)
MLRSRRNGAAARASSEAMLTKSPFALLCVQAAVAARWQGHASGQDGADAAAQMRKQGYAVIGVAHIKAMRTALALQNRTRMATPDCITTGPDGHVDVMGSDPMSWGKLGTPPCWKHGFKPLQQLFDAYKSLARWVLAAAAAQHPTGKEWLKEAYREAEEGQVLLRALSYHTLTNVGPKPLPSDASVKFSKPMAEGWTLRSQSDRTSFELDLADWSCESFNVPSFLVRGDGSFEIYASPDAERWQLVASGLTPPSPLTVASLHPERSVRYLQVLGTPELSVTPLGACAGLAAPNGKAWGHTPPHQEASWVTIVLEDSPALNTKLGRQGVQWRPQGFGPLNAVVLVGARLSVASEGYYPAPCHAVEVTSRPRLSWSFVYPANTCLYRAEAAARLRNCALEYRPGIDRQVPLENLGYCGASISGDIRSTAPQRKPSNSSSPASYNPLTCIKPTATGQCDDDDGGAYSYRSFLGTCAYSEVDAPRDQACVAALPHIFPEVTSVMDFGGGPGVYLTSFRDAGLKDLVTMEPNALGECLFRGIKQDTTNVVRTALSHLSYNRYDLVQTIECVEHVPVAFHRHLVNFLTRATRKWLLFSAAHPGQAGVGHVGPSMKTPQKWKDEILATGRVRFDAQKTAEFKQYCGGILAINGLVFRRL